MYEDVWELGEEMSRGGYAGGRPEGRGVVGDGEDMVALYIRIIQPVYCGYTYESDGAWEYK